ncbi:MAG: phage holin family protein [Acetatifactor sp.]|nr:phage holin family protein [Acetatifactor sp.]
MHHFKKDSVKRSIKNFAVAVGAGFYFFIAGMLLFGANGYAYIDPSVMTYVIQAVSGIVIAIGAVAGIYWRRAKKKLNEKFDIDENKNKEVESDDIEVYKE